MTEPEHTPESLEARLERDVVALGIPQEAALVHHYKAVAEEAIDAYADERQENFEMEGTLERAMDERDEAVKERDRLEAYLHSREAHPDYEYMETTGPRKSWYDQDTPPEGDGWERNVHRGRDGWERFDYHEESYWMRKTDGDEA